MVMLLLLVVAVLLLLSLSLSVITIVIIIGLHRALTSSVLVGAVFWPTVFLSPDFDGSEKIDISVSLGKENIIESVSYF